MAAVFLYARGVQSQYADFSKWLYEVDTLQISSYAPNLESYEVWLHNITSLLTITTSESSVKSTWSLIFSR